MFYVHQNQYGFVPEAFTSAPNDARRAVRDAPTFTTDFAAWDWIASVAYKRVAIARGGLHQINIGSRESAESYAARYGWRVDSVTPAKSGRGVVANLAPC